jgi:hypothetical protein
MLMYTIYVHNVYNTHTHALTYIHAYIHTHTHTHTYILPTARMTPMQFRRLVRSTRARATVLIAPAATRKISSMGFIHGGMKREHGGRGEDGYVQNEGGGRWEGLNRMENRGGRGK